MLRSCWLGSYTLVATNVPFLQPVVNKNDDVERTSSNCQHPEAKADLATAFVAALSLRSARTGWEHMFWLHHRIGCSLR